MKQLRDLLVAANESVDYKMVDRTRGIRITNNCVRVPICYYCNYMNEPVYVLSVEDAVKRAKELNSRGVHRVTLVSGWLGYKNEMVVPYATAIKSELPELTVSGAFGPITKASLKKLKQAGLDQYGCNLEAVPEVLLKIKGTDDIPERIETLKNARKVGLKVSSGYIIGVEENETQLTQLFDLLKKVDPDRVFMTPLEAYPDTPMHDWVTPTIKKTVETVAKTRLLFKNKTLGLRIIRQGSFIPVEFLSLAVYAGISLVAPPPEFEDMSVVMFRKLLKNCADNLEQTQQRLLCNGVSEKEAKEFIEIVQLLPL
ncbi:MAG: radical SAM protein [Candidatus Bathyarchaeota archaeon]|nr:radical SAM protein [Candidatus Bathyarchaeota archaeon]